MKAPYQPARAKTLRLMNRRPGDRGATLVVGLIVLVVMAILGIGSMRTSALQELMAGHTKDSNSAFQGAEAALQAAHSYVCNLERPEQMESPGAGGVRIPEACRSGEADPVSCQDRSTNRCCYFRGTIAAWKAYPRTPSDTLSGHAIGSLSGAGWAPVSNTPHFIIEYRRSPHATSHGEFDGMAAGGRGSGGSGDAADYFATIATIGFDPAANSRTITQMTQKLNF